MLSALIGHSGYVGTTLLRQRAFDCLYRSANVAESAGKDFDLVVCAAAPAQKWIANREPERDRQVIDGLIGHLRAIRAMAFVLVSTVDVFRNSLGVTEDTPVDEEGLHAYGLNRRRLEKAVLDQFENALVIRLPGLVGPGLRKNAVFDFLNDNNVHAIDSRGVFQFYPMVCLWKDIETALALGIPLLHLTAEPVSVAEVALSGFGREFRNELAATPATYDMRSLHAGAFGGSGNYQYSRRESLLAIRAYAQSEPVTLAKGARS
jgi:hypothetical protein